MNKPGARFAKWVVGGPPFVFLLLFFALPALIMVLASFRYPGEFGGLASLFPLTGSDESGLTAENYRVFASDWIYSQIFLKSFGVAALTTLACLVMAYPLALRPEMVQIFADGAPVDPELSNRFHGTVKETVYVGNVTTNVVTLDNGQKIETLLPNSGSGRVRFFEIGDSVQVAWRPDAGHFVAD